MLCAHVCMGVYAVCYVCMCVHAVRARMRAFALYHVCMCACVCMVCALCACLCMCMCVCVFCAGACVHMPRMCSVCMFVYVCVRGFACACVHTCELTGMEIGRREGMPARINIGCYNWWLSCMCAEALFVLLLDWWHGCLLVLHNCTAGLLSVGCCKGPWTFCRAFLVDLWAVIDEKCLLYMCVKLCRCSQCECVMLFCR